MFFKVFSVFVPWKKVASALEGLRHVRWYMDLQGYMDLCLYPCVHPKKGRHLYSMLISNQSSIYAYGQRLTVSKLCGISNGQDLRINLCVFDIQLIRIQCNATQSKPQHNFLKYTNNSASFCISFSTVA